MPVFNYHHPIEVRYGDIDAQGHVNNARYLTYLEQARVGYLNHLGLWDGQSFMDVGIILADARLTFKAPISLGQPIQVGIRTTRIGNKSLDMAYQIEDTRSGQILATGATVLVAYDYRENLTVPVPTRWRQVITVFDNLDSDHPQDEM